MALRLAKGISREPTREKARKTREEYLLECLSEEAEDPRFTPWEREFVRSLARQLSRGRPPTPKQKAVLERLWQK